jgi:hypothetical protein
MKFKHLLTITIGVILWFVATVATPAATGLEASAAADQVKTGFNYLQARAEMDLWARACQLTRIAGYALIFSGVLFSILPKKQKA